MHLTRPKSSKGRSRPAGNLSVPAGDTYNIQRPPASPDSPSRPTGSLRSRSQPIMWQTLQRAPETPFNKYKVLPSIERRQPEVSPGKSLEEQMSKSTLCDGAMQYPKQGHEEPDPSAGTQTSSTGVDKNAGVQLCPQPPDPGVVTSKEAAATLLLAIRAPCGRRFQQHFDPTDTLMMVRASAEVRYGATYENASIETMDVPRRTFTDMDKTLAQCGIMNRSVLCISENDTWRFSVCCALYLDIDLQVIVVEAWSRWTDRDVNCNFTDVHEHKRYTSTYCQFITIYFDTSTALL